MHIQLENQKMSNPQLAAGFQPIEIYLAEVMRQLRTLSHTLNNDFIGHIGLWAAIQTEADRLRGLKRFAVHVHETQGRTFLTKEEELMVFRIFQEITQNVLKHAQAQHLYIDASASETHFQLKVTDDGKGFDVEEILHTARANGLRNILKRSRMAGMECDIKSLPDQGCTIVLQKITQPV
jgi:signal transduction histidine kinase